MVESKLDDEENELLDTDSVEEAEKKCSEVCKSEVAAFQRAWDLKDVARAKAKKDACMQRCRDSKQESWEIHEANIVKVVDGLVDKIANSGNFKGAIAWQEYEDTRKKNSKYDAKDKKKALEIIKKFKIK